MAIGKNPLNVNPVNTALKILNKKKQRVNKSEENQPKVNQDGVSSSVSIPDNVKRYSDAALAEKNAGKKGQTYQIGNTILTKAEYDVARGQLGFTRGNTSGEITPELSQILSTRPGSIEYQAAQELAKQNTIKGIGQLTPEELAQARQDAEKFVQPGGILPGNINLNQAIAAGAADVTTGLAVATPVAGVAAATGAGLPIAGISLALGALGGFVKGAYSDIKSQQGGQVKAEKVSVTKAITNLNNIVSAVNQGAPPEEALILYNQQILQVYTGWASLKLQTQGTAAAFDDGTKELAEFEIFFNPNGGTLSTINLKMAQAVQNPNPSKVEASTLQDFIYSES